MKNSDMMWYTIENIVISRNLFSSLADGFCVVGSTRFSNEYDD